MKSLAELAALREQMHDKVAIREGLRATRVVVAMGTCGIAAGARDVLAAFVEGVAAENLTASVTVTQSGCIGDCENEPCVVVNENGNTTTYVKMSADRAKRVVTEHLKGGKVVTEFTK